MTAPTPCPNPQCGRLRLIDEACPHCNAPAGSANPSPPTKPCPYCGESILAVARKCKHCQSDLIKRPAPKAPAEANGYGIALLAIPVVASFLIWFWVGNMNLLQSPGSALGLIAVGVVFSTACIAALEVSQAPPVKRQGGALTWFFVMVALWIVSYPAYLHHRRRFGQANYLLVGLLVTLVFMGSLGAVWAAVDHRINTVQTLLGGPFNPPQQAPSDVLDLQIQAVQASLDLYRLENGRYPTEQEGLSALISPPPDALRWSGPYVDGSLRLALQNIEYTVVGGRPFLTPKR